MGRTRLVAMAVGAVCVTALAVALTRPGPRTELSKAQVQTFSRLAARLRRDCPPPAASAAIDRRQVARDVDAVIAFAKRHPTGWHMEDGVGLFKDPLQTDVVQTAIWNVDCGEPAQIERMWAQARKMSGSYGPLLPAVLQSRWNVARSDLAYRCLHSPSTGLPPAGARAARRDVATLFQVDRAGVGHLVHQALGTIPNVRRCGIASELRAEHAAARRP